MKEPRLLYTGKARPLPTILFNDLQFDKLLSKSTITVLSYPCTRTEILRRNELFSLLEQEENVERMEHVLSILSAHEKALKLLDDSPTPLERYYCHEKVLNTYIVSCNALSSLREFGSLFTAISNYYGADERSMHLADMKESVKTIRALLFRIQEGLVSYSDKIWITPAGNVVGEFNAIANCAEKLGFTVPTKKKLHHTKVNLSLSNAICRLYAEEIFQIEAEIAKYTGIDFHQPTAYTPEIKFFLEIRRLIERTNKIGVPHCIAQIAPTPKYTAKSLCDISLLAKKCQKIVLNDAEFTKAEPFFFLTGANGGGKTTFLRAVGINLVLFLAGCPVFAKQAEIFPFDIVMSHFPKDERFDNTGRLDEEKQRTDEMFRESKSKSAFLLLNETFSGTDDKRGFELLNNLMVGITENNCFGIYVTHFHEVVTLDYPVLSAEVDLANDNKRTFRIVKSKGIASSYALDVLKKYRLDKGSLAERRYTRGT